ncbi:hypothetical protein [Arhodomonas sp. AD133]|uniref:hypothetical protein n=1 Tax=Arhodomonas sp. AD133 TaxID=3415009 RepID=UPI003EBFD87B
MRANNVMRLRWPNPVGLAAGVDRHGRCLAKHAAAGFGAIEIGTIRPDSLGEAVANLTRWRESRGQDSPAVGANIGCCPGASWPEAEAQYRWLAARLAPWVDYLVVNPTALAEARPRRLVRLLDSVRHHVAGVPLLIKLATLAPALRLERLSRLGYDGLVLVLPDHPWDERPAWLRILRVSERRGMTVVAVGGIDSPDRVRHCLASGASMVQVHRPYVSGGERLITRLLDGCLPAAV